jgi:hypothetical protein
MRQASLELDGTNANRTSPYDGPVGTLVPIKTPLTEEMGVFVGTLQSQGAGSAQPAGRLPFQLGTDEDFAPPMMAGQDAHSNGLPGTRQSWCIGPCGKGPGCWRKAKER